MMRSVAIIALFACHVEAVKIESGGGAMAGMIKMLQGMKNAAVDEKAIMQKDCVVDITTKEKKRDSLRAELSRLIGAGRIPSAIEHNGQYEVHAHGAAAAQTDDKMESCQAANGSTNCAGEWEAANSASDLCKSDITTQSLKAKTAKEQAFTAMYGNSNQSPVRCTVYTQDPGNADVSVCATEWRIEDKQSTEATVAKNCKKTVEIMDIAISIYKGKGAGASFLQLAQEEHLRADAKAFLESKSGTESETERSNELLKLLHDFLQQLKRDCSQDLSDLKSDINALRQHMASKQNTYASEMRAHDLATSRQHEAKKCHNANSAARAKIHTEAENAYSTFEKICPGRGGDTTLDGTFQCSTSHDADFTCKAGSDIDRTSDSCKGSLMWEEGNCKKMDTEMSNYIEALGKAIELMKSLPDPSFVQVPSFIQLAENEEGPTKTAMVQQGAVDFAELVSAIKEAISNEIEKLNSDASDVNAFAAQCEKMLTPLNGGEDPVEAGCTYKAGELCSTQSPTSNTCSVCMQQAQCDEMNELAIVARNNATTAQNSQDSWRTLFEEAQAEYATATRNRAVKAARFARTKSIHESDELGMSQAHGELGTFANAQGTTPEQQAALTSLQAVIQDTIDSENVIFAALESVENGEVSNWESTDPTNVDSAAYYTAQLSADCATSNAHVDLSKNCKMQEQETLKIAAQASLATYENAVFNECQKTGSTLNQAKAALSARQLECKVGVTKDLKEELHKMEEALQILQQAKTKIAGTA